jgi:HPt (histidine-containing phosphotransfer) domain-containing protein
MTHDLRDDDAVDLDILDEVRELLGSGGGDLFSELVNLFFQEAKSHLEQMRASAAVGDTVGVAQAAHRLHGSAGYVGAREMMTLSAEIERRADRDDLDGIEERISRLWQMLDALAPRLLA